MKNEVSTMEGRRYAGWLSRISYKPGVHLSVDDYQGFTRLRIASWREDSTLDWGPAARKEWEQTIGEHRHLTSNSAHLGDLSPLEDEINRRYSRLTRQMVQIAMNVELRRDIFAFPDFMAEIRKHLLALESHEMDEWIRVDEGFLPYDPHRMGLSAQTYLEERERDRESGDLVRHKTRGAKQRLTDPLVAYPDRLKELLFEASSLPEPPKQFIADQILRPLSEYQSRFVDAAMSDKEVDLQHTRKGPAWVAKDKIIPPPSA